MRSHYSKQVGTRLAPFVVVVSFFFLLAISLQFANAASPGPLVDLSNTTEASSLDPQIAASGSNIYVAWSDNSNGNFDILFKKITILGNGTLAYSDTLSLNDNNADSADPQIAASGSNVFVVWSTTNNDILFAASTDEGSSFRDTVNLSNDTFGSASGKLFASDSNVYVVWVDGNFDILFKKITILDNGTFAYADTMRLDDNGTNSFDPQIAASGSNVYVVWSTTDNDNDILFAASTDEGSSFGNTVNVSNNTGSSVDPRMVASGANAYLVWRDDTEILSGYSDLFFKKLTIEGNNSVSLGDLADLSDTTNGSYEPSIAFSPSTDDLFVTWSETTNLDPPESDILIRKITNDGTTLGNALSISHNAGNSVDPHLTTHPETGNVFLIWRDDHLSSTNSEITNNEILSSASLDGGANFGCPINISNSPENSLAARLTLVDTDSLTGPFVVMYQVPLDFSPSDIFLQKGIDYQAKLITIDPLTNLSPRWGIDAISISGSVANVEPGDKVVVNWGDGTSNQTAISGCSWGPVEHTYGDNATGNNPNQIVAKMADNSGNEMAASDPVALIVLPHTISLSLDQILAVKQGDNITVTGSITDESTGAGLEDKNITFDGTGAIGLPESGVLSSSNGSFVAIGPAPNFVASGWTVMAHFDADSAYLTSDSGQRIYDTVTTAATEFSVESGVNSIVELNGFNASVLFQNAVDAGKVFVADCDPPESTRYIALDCLEISPAVKLAEGSGGLVNISYVGEIPPNGSNASEIDIFHETSPGTVVDITQGRDLSASTVSGNVTSFSKFIIGVALHGTKPEGAIRQQVFLGNVNEVSFRNIENKGNSTAIASLDKTSYLMTDTAVLTISDAEGNLDANSIDIVSAGVISETSSRNNLTDGITLVLHETGVNSSIFKASFTFTTGNSSGTTLQANSGDKLTVSYNIGPRARVFINGVAESGVVQMNDYSVEQTAQFTPLGGSVNMTLIDGQLATDANVTVVMSYANAHLLGNEEQFLRILQRVGDSVWIDITKLDTDGNNIGVDKVNKTVTGRTGSLGSFSIGVDVGKPGGAGGGLSRPGTGIVLDFVATLVSPPPHSSGTGGHSSNTGSAQIVRKEVTSGNGVEVKATTAQSSGLGGDEIKISFEKVESGGQLVVTQKSLPDLSTIFESTTSTVGRIAIGGGQYVTAGSIFDIDASNIKFIGSVNVTIPYNESIITSGSGTEGSLLESDVRFLHYNGSAWEDVTIFINTTANTVTGRIAGSLSPVVAAVIDDGTFASLYFELNPLSKFVIANATLSSRNVPVAETIKLSSGEPITLSVAIKNIQRVDQTYAFIVQVIDKDGIVTGLSWSTGVLGRGNSTEISRTFTPSLGESGSHTIQLFIWSGMEEPYALSDVLVKNLEIK